MQFATIVNVLIATVRGFISNQAVVEAIKAAVREAATHTEWGDGEKTEFVIRAGRAVVAATPTPTDDFLYEIAAYLYMRKYTHPAGKATS